MGLSGKSEYTTDFYSKYYDKGYEAGRKAGIEEMREYAKGEAMNIGVSWQGDDIYANADQFIELLNEYVRKGEYER